MSYSFTGITQLDSQSCPSPNQDFHWVAWVSPVASMVSQGSVFSFHTFWYDTYVEVSLDPVAQKAVLTIKKDGTVQATVQKSVPNEFYDYHLIDVYRSGNTWGIGVDAEAALTTNVSVTVSSPLMTFGRFVERQAFIGTLYQSAFFYGNLDNADKQGLYDAGPFNTTSAVNVVSATMQAYWQFTNSRLYDYSGSYDLMLTDLSQKVTKDNLIFAYRSGDVESYVIAQRYKDIHSLDNSQIVALPCSSNEILDDYATFVTEVETPIKTAIQSIGFDVGIIVLGYNVPGGFNDGDDVVSSTSRLSRLYHTFSKQSYNPLFNRSDTSYTKADVFSAMICSRIDGPTYDRVINWINKTAAFIQQGTANGVFYFDPYTSSPDLDEQAYMDELFAFQAGILPLLHLDRFSTVYWDEYTDVVIPKLQQDSFMWSLQSIPGVIEADNNHAGYTFFTDTNTSRIFLYNADKNGASTVRDVDNKLFPMLALSSGYVNSAGAMSDPTPMGYLRPTPFFLALLAGCTVGEAYLYSCPILDWTMTLFGDPLATSRFPAGAEVTNTSSQFLNWETVSNYTANIAAYSVKRANDFHIIFNECMLIDDIDKALLLNDAYSLAQSYDASWETALTPLINAFIQYSTGFSTVMDAFQTFLSDNSLKISSLFPQISDNAIVSDVVLYTEGFWKVETILTHTKTKFSRYHFELDIASDSEFTGILYSLKSNVNSAGWLYEKEPGVFDYIPTSGVPSNLAGCRIKYESLEAQYMDRATRYYYRIRQKEGTDYSVFVSGKSIVNT